MSSEMFEKEAIGAMPRLISLLDRDKNSPRYGCFDRDYWHYKLSADFPGASFQQAVLSLALVYSFPFSGNVYFKNRAVLQYIIAGMDFWAGIQNNDGSFNEWYPNEHSYVATAFTSYGISESLRILSSCGARVENEEKIHRALVRSGRWLLKNKDTFLSNHVAGSVAALYNIYLLTADKEFKDGCRNKLKELSAKQSDEGWFDEYGGADIGYQSLTIDFLSRYEALSQDPSVGPMLEKALEFMVYFMHPDGSSGGEYASRNTKYIMPCGFEILASKNKNAAYIASLLRQRFSERRDYLRPCDDRYFVFFFLPAFLQAWVVNGEKKFLSPCADDPRGQSFIKVFKGAGLISRKNRVYHSICNYKKGGVVKVFPVSDKRGIILDQCGYSGTLSGGRRVSSQWLESGNKATGTLSDEVFEITREFVYLDYSLPLRHWLIPFRVFTASLGRFNVFASLFSSWIRTRRILSKHFCPVTLNRKVSLGQNEVVIEDTLINKNGFEFIRLVPVSGRSFLHVPSSRYFCEDELRDGPEFDLSAALNGRKECRVLYKVLFKNDGVAVTVEADGESVFSA